MNSLRTQLIILYPRHEALAQALVNDEQNLRCDLRTQESGLVIPDILPFREVFRDLGHFDAGGSLPVRGMAMLLFFLSDY